MLDNGYSVPQMPCPAQTLVPQLFLEVLKILGGERKKKDPGNESNQSVAPLSWQTDPFNSSSTLLPFYTEKVYKPQRRGLEGKIAESRMWIHPRQTHTVWEICTAVQVATRCRLRCASCFLLLWSRIDKSRMDLCRHRANCFNLISAHMIGLRQWRSLKHTEWWNTRWSFYGTEGNVNKKDFLSILNPLKLLILLHFSTESSQT